MDEEKDIRKENERIEYTSHRDVNDFDFKKPDHSEERWVAQTTRVVYYILGVIEVLLAFRFLFRLLGASTGSGFVALLYSLTRILIQPFIGIFSSVSSGGNAAGYVFEPATIIAMIVYAVIARGIVSLVRLRVPHRV